MEFHVTCIANTDTHTNPMYSRVDSCIESMNIAIVIQSILIANKFCCWFSFLAVILFEAQFVQVSPSNIEYLFLLTYI